MAGSEYIAQQVEEIVSKVETRWRLIAGATNTPQSEREIAQAVANEMARLNDRLGSLNWCGCQTEVSS